MARVRAKRKLGYSVKGRFYLLLAGQIADVPDDVVKRNPHWFEAVEEPEVEPETSDESTEEEEPEVVDTQQEPAANTQVKRVRRRRK